MSHSLLNAGERRLGLTGSYATSFTEGRGRTRVGVVEPGRELQETALGEGGIGEPVRLGEHAADARAQRLGEMFEDVPPLVDLAALDERHRPACLPDRLAEPAPAVEREEDAVLARRDADRDRLQGAGVEGIAVRRVREARAGELVAINAAGAQARHEDAPPAEGHLAARLAVAIRTARGVGDVLRSAQPLAILFHHRAQHLLAGLETEPEERGARAGKDVEQRQRNVNRGDGWGRDCFPGG